MMGINKRIGLVAVQAFFCIASFAFAEEVDFRQVNPVMQVLVDNVIRADENVEFAYPQFDVPYSDLSAERLKYDVVGTLKNTPWLKQGRAEVKGTSTYAGMRDLARSGISVKMSATVHTDVMALLRYGAASALKQRHASLPLYDARIDAHLKRLSVVREVSELYDILYSSQELSKEILSHELKISGEHPEYERIYKQIEEIQLTKTSTGVQLVSSSIDSLFFDPNSRGSLRMGKVSLELKPSDILVENESFYEMTLSKLDQLKSELKTKLIGLQAGDEASKADVQDRLRNALVVFRKTIRGNIAK